MPLPAILVALALLPAAQAQEASTDTLKQVSDPDELRRYTERSGRLEPFRQLPPGGVVDAEDGADDPDSTDLAARGIETAAGLSMLEKLRPGGYFPPAQRGEGKGGGSQAQISPAPVERGGFEDVGTRSWGRRLLEGITEDWLTLDVRTRSGAVLTLEYDDLSTRKERGDAEVRPKQGRYRIVVDRALRGTEAELAIKAHELSHIRDAEELPDARPEWMGLLMEYRANLYEIATYLERHKDIRQEPHPRNFYDAEVWFKARVFAGGLDASFADEIPSGGAWGQVKGRAKSILADCERVKAASCGGMGALRKWVLDPIYADTDEGNILTWDLTELEEPELIARDRALAYQNETAWIENSVRSGYGLHP